MKTQERKISPIGLIIALVLLVNTIVISKAFTESSSWYWGLLFTIPLLGIVIWEARHQESN